jgi:hypothetical protein
MNDIIHNKCKKCLCKECIGIAIQHVHDAENYGVGSTHCFYNSYNNGPSLQRTTTAKLLQHHHHLLCKEDPKTELININFTVNGGSKLLCAPITVHFVTTQITAV